MADDGEEAMPQSREVNINWLRINVPSVAAIVGTGVIIAMYVQGLASKVDKIEENRQARSAMIDKGFDRCRPSFSRWPTCLIAWESWNKGCSPRTSGWISTSRRWEQRSMA